MRRTAFVGLLALALAGCGSSGGGRPGVVGDPGRGKDVIVDVGCGACHTIPGIRGADARVAPNLTGWSSERYIAGKFGNYDANLVRWLMNPQRLNPGTLMPNLGLSRGQARDVAAYLYERT